MNKPILALLAVIILGAGAYLFFSNSERAQNGLNGPEEPEAATISWTEAVELIRNCEVDMLFQSHALDVQLYLKSGERVHAIEPTIDDVFRVYEESVEACGTIPIATE